MGQISSGFIETSFLIVKFAASNRLPHDPNWAVRGLDKWWESVVAHLAESAGWGLKPRRVACRTGARQSTRHPVRSWPNVAPITPNVTEDPRVTGARIHNPPVRDRDQRPCHRCPQAEQEEHPATAPTVCGPISAQAGGRTGR